MSGSRLTSIATGAAAMALLAGAAAAGTVLGAADTVSPTPTSITVTPAAQPAACTGALTIPVGSLEGDEFASDPTERSRQVFGGEVVDDGAEVVEGLFGASIERVADGDIAGYAALACGTPSTSQWLVGGSTSLESSARLVLVNPTQANVEATVTIFGAGGEIESQRVVAIAAGGVADTLLEAVQDGLDAVAVRVEATGAGVVAAIQDSALDGLQPAGTDWVASVTSLGSSLVVPTVSAGDLESTAELRIVAPEGATVSLSLADESGTSAWSGASEVTLEPGVVTTIPVPEGASGAVVIEADGPVAAAAEITVTRASDIGAEGSLASDRTWVPAEPMPVAGETVDGGVYWPGDEGLLTAYTPEATTLAVLDASGTQIAEVQTEAGAVTRVDVDAAEGEALTLVGDAAWTVEIVGDGGFLASMRVLPATVVDLEVQAVDAPYVP